LSTQTGLIILCSVLVLVGAGFFVKLILSEMSRLRETLASENDRSRGFFDETLSRSRMENQNHLKLAIEDIGGRLGTLQKSTEDRLEHVRS
jgi:hypothetical protein